MLFLFQEIQHSAVIQVEDIIQNDPQNENKLVKIHFPSIWIEFLFICSFVHDQFLEIPKTLKISG